VSGAVEDLFEKLDDTRFNLIVIGQATPSKEALGLGDLLRVHAVADDRGNDAALLRAAISQPSFYLLRPDGHVGLCGTTLEPGALRRYVDERLRIRSLR